MASSANGLELQEMAEVSGQKPKQPETTETQIRAPLASITSDISLSSESSAEEDEEFQIGGQEKWKLLKPTPQLERQEMAQISGQKPRQIGRQERQRLEAMASSANRSPSSESSAEEDEESQIGGQEKWKLLKPTPQLERLEMAEVSGQKPKQTSDKKWIEKNIKLRNSKDEEPSKPCDAFGEIHFMGYYQENATFVRVDHQTPMEIMMCLIRSTWNIRLPSLLISVIGGREDIQLNPHTEAVGRSLYKAARTIDAWIITEGLHTGVAKYIGKVMYKNVVMNEVTILGIAPWNCVLQKKLLVNKGLKHVCYYTRTNPEEEMYALDPIHSHFILVDDGTKGNFGEIIEFRKKLEHTISQEKIPKTEVKIPAVAVMVGGGPGTLKSVHDSISRNIPVVIVKDTGRAADILADAYQTKLENSNEEDEEENDRIREQIIKEFEKELKGEGIDNVVYYVLESLKQPNLLTVYDKDSEKEFDLTMFKAVFKAKNNIENMGLGLAWNKPDVLKRLISEGEAPWEDVKKWIQENIKLRNLRDKEAPNPCDAFGEVKFVEHDQKIAKFVRVDHQTPMNIIIHLIIYQWDFSLPNLLISVIGGREDVQLNEPAKEALGHSLVKAARTTDAWIISEGLHSGVVKYIGEAISDNENEVADMKKVKTIGIARWNCVQNKESLVNKEGLWPANYSNGGEYALDPNHTHFILVDDGTNDTSGVELEFKKQLEDTILQIKRQIPLKPSDPYQHGGRTLNDVGIDNDDVDDEVKIPAVVVMVGEELETLMSAFDSLSRNIPVIILKGSGKAADIMADVYEALLKKDEEGKDITERSILKQLKADIEKQQGANDLVDCVFNSMRYLDLITVCNIQSPEDFDIAIMKAVFKGRKELKEVKLTSKRKGIDSLQNNVFSEGTQWQCGRRKKNNELVDIFWRKIDIKKWIQENIKLRNATDEEPSKPCDAFGEVKFPEDGWNIAKFVRVDHQISMETTIDLIKRLWFSSLPNLLISVIGERQDFQLDPFAREAFGRGLVKAAQITGAWIISDGLRVAKHIGKAIHDNEAAVTGKKKVVTIGIASWNCVQNKESLVNEEGSWPANYEIKNYHYSESTLDPNHSHFILVDDVTRQIPGVGAEFRKKLEDTISQYKIPETGFKVPAVVVLVGGELETLKSVFDSISRNIPVVIVKGYGGVADVMASVYRKLFGYLKEEHTDLSTRAYQLKYDIDREIILGSKEYLNRKKIIELLKYVIESLKHLNLLTVYNIHSSEDFDVVIKKALIKAKNGFKYLPFSSEWREIYKHLNDLLTDEIRLHEDEMDSSDEESDLEFDEYFEQIQREDEMDSSDEESDSEFDEYFEQIQREDEIDGPFRKSDLEVDEYFFEQLKRKDDKDSSDEERSADDSWLEKEPEIDQLFTKIFTNIISSGHSGYKYGYKNIVKYSREEESNTNSLSFQRTISYCIPNFPLKIPMLDDVQELVQEDIKLRNTLHEEPSKPCDAFGTVNFVGCWSTAEFLRVDHKTPMGMMMYLIKFLWNLELPELLISMIGERKDLQLTPKIETFVRRLVKAAKTKGAWIISTGLHTGIEKHIGKTINDVKNEIVTIGIAPWNCVQNKESLVKKGSRHAEYEIKDDTDSTTYALDPRHSYFILVDDGTQETSGVEMEFRKMFENTITDLNISETGFKVPAVVVLVGGELETLKSVSDSISRNIPVVIVKGTGQAADIMAYAYERVFGKLKDLGSLKKLEQLKKDIRQKITEEFEGLNINDVYNTGDCVLSSLRRPKLLTVYDINSAEDFGVAILKAVFKTKNKCRNLKLTFKWERLDNALNELFTELASWHINELDNVMLFALKEGKSDIVELFLEYKINLKVLLTEEDISILYKMKNTNLTVDTTCKEFLDKFLKDIHQEKANVCFATKLFLWALFFNRKEMAILFWKEGMGALSSALIANNLLKSLKGKCKEYGTSKQLQEQAEYYEKHAIGILDECLYTDEKQTLDLLLLQQKMWDNSSNMQIAFDLNNEKFMAHDACQSVLTKIWMKQINKTNSIWKLLLCIVCPLFLFLIKFDYKEQDSDMESKETCCSKPHGNCGIKKCMMFYNTPVIKFWISLIFYVIFLGIYSYVLLVELKQQMSVLEWLLIVWVIGIFTEEIHQMSTKRSLSIWSKFKKYIDSAWDIIDVITIVLFILGYILRLLDVAETARVIFCLNLISFYIRFLHMFSIDKNLGPKLVMIKEMMRDLGYFAMILFTFMIAFGIATQSILNPSTPASSDLFKEVFRKAYFLIYAELFLEEYEGNPNCKENNSTCPTEITTYSAITLMCIYVLLTNILLLNLLIAMFSSTYEKVQEKSNLLWFFQRYYIINEFSIRPLLPPPFVILSNIYQFCRYLYQTRKHEEPKIKHVFSPGYHSAYASYLLEWEHKMVQSYFSRQHKPDSNDKDLINQLKSKVEELHQQNNSQDENIEEKFSKLCSRIDQLTLKVKELQQQLNISQDENTQNIEEKFSNLCSQNDQLTLKEEELQQQLNNSQFENSQNIEEKFSNLCSQNDQLTLKVEELQQQLNISQDENTQNNEEKFSKLCSRIDQLTLKEEELQHNVDEKMENIDSSLAWIKENLMETKP